MTTTSPLGEELHRTLRSFTRLASGLQDLLEDPSTELSLAYKLRFTKGEALETTFTKGSEVARHAALLRPFMASGSATELSRVWDSLRAAGVIDEETRSTIEGAFDEAEHLSIPVKVNGEVLTSRDVYVAYGEGEFFGEDEEARQRLGAISYGPLQGLVPMLFHEACERYTRLVFVLLEVILDVEREHPPGEAETEDAHQCIYCLATEGDFGTEEHVIAKSLGGDELVLTGCVCARCNNELSVLDQILLDFDALAMLRTIYGPMTKKGKFQRARLRDIDIERTAPRSVRFTEKSGRPALAFEELPDGTVKGSLQMESRKPFDPVPIARALFKIGLGLVAYHAGPEAALGNRYDSARAFIRGDSLMPGYLVIPTQAKPGPSIRTTWLPADGATPVVLDIYGLRFAFNLEPMEATTPDIPEIVADSFWLGGPPPA